MTTPALNINETIKRQSTSILIRDGDGYTSTTVYDRPHRNYTRTRPESITNPLVKGWRKPSNYWSNVDRYILSPDTYSVDRSTAGYTGYKFGSLLWPAKKPGFPSYPSTLRDAAEIKALGKAKDQKVNLSVALAEYKQTGELLSSSVTRIARSVSNWRRLHPKQMWDRIVRNQRSFKRSFQGGKAANLGRGIPNSWLEVQYGWNPLMADIYGACEALANKYTHESFRIGVTGTAKYHDTVWETWNNGGSFNPVATIEQQLEFEAMVKVRLDYYVGNEFLRTMAQLGVTNPLEVVWEKVPYSFVIDWFLPVGAYLSVLDADMGLVFKGGSHTTVRRLKSGGGWRQSFRFPITELIVRGLPHTDRMSMQRSQYLQSPLPRAPVLKNPISAGHIANAMSLLASSFRHLR